MNRRGNLAEPLILLGETRGPGRREWPGQYHGVYDDDSDQEKQNNADQGCYSYCEDSVPKATYQAALIRGLGTESSQ